MNTRFDNKIFLFLESIVDLIWISLLWYISSILIVTAGASCAALYFTVHKRIFKKEGYLFATYKSAFLDNFRKATLIWILCIILDAFLWFDFILARMAIDQGSVLAVFYYPVLVCMVMALMWQLSIMAYQARFDDTVKNVFKKAAMIAATNFGWMVFLAATLIGMIVLCRYLIVLVIVLPAVYACLMHHVFEHIYKKTGWIKEEEE